MKQFYSFLTEAESLPEPKRLSDDIVNIFGRHNPPHLGHKMTMDRAHDLAGSIGDKAPADQSFWTSRSHDPKKNPLPFQMKLQFLKQMFPEHAEKWNTNSERRSLLASPMDAFEKGYKNFHMVVGDDRKEATENVLRKYNGELYEFDNIYTHSAGPRMDPNDMRDDPIAKLSSSGLRGMAQKGDFDGFLGGMPLGKGFKEADARKLFDAVQMFGQKNESWETDRDMLREFYKSGKYIQEGDIVESLDTSLRGEVQRCGANHIICTTEDGIMFKSFIHDVFLVDKYL